MTRDVGGRWAVVLAGGSGTRLGVLTRGADGLSVPKQYCSLRGGRSLLGETLERAERLVGRGRTLVVVAREHDALWRRELRHLPDEHVLVQPANRGTAAGVLLPTLALLERDPRARVAFFPADHHVEREGRLRAALRRALARVSGADAKNVLLLGIEPDRAETQYGWIVPAERGLDPGPVAAFVEKPPREVALRLLAAGGLWNSFLFAARATALVELFALRQPELLRRYRAAFERPFDDRARALQALYADLPLLDFCRDLLERSVDRLRVGAVPACGWTDLGTPERVAELLRSRPLEAGRASMRSAAPVVLARALAAGRTTAAS